MACATRDSGVNGVHDRWNIDSLRLKPPHVLSSASDAEIPSS